MATPQRRTGKSRLTFDDVRGAALALPQVEEYVCYGTPAFRVRKKLMARLREDGETLVVKVDDLARQAWFAIDPEIYFLTDHYRGYPVMLVRFAGISAAALHKIVDEAWQQVAPKRLRENHPASSAS